MGMVLIRNALAPESFDIYVQEVKLAKGRIYPHMRMRFSMFAKKISIRKRKQKCEEHCLLTGLKDVEIKNEGSRLNHCVSVILMIVSIVFEPSRI